MFIKSMKVFTVFLLAICIGGCPYTSHFAKGIIEEFKDPGVGSIIKVPLAFTLMCTMGPMFDIASLGGSLTGKDIDTVSSAVVATTATGFHQNKSEYNQPHSSAASTRPKTTSYESCVCGPDYIPCFIRHSIENGEKYTTHTNTSESGHTSFSVLDGKLVAGSTHTWRGGNDCQAMNR